jgi:hypothetical protein
MNPFVIPFIGPIVSLVAAVVMYSIVARVKEAAKIARVTVDDEANKAKVRLIEDEAKARELVRSELAQWSSNRTILDEAHTISLIQNEVAKADLSTARDFEAKIRLIFQSELAQWQVGFVNILDRTYLRGTEADLRFGGVEKAINKIEQTVHEAVLLKRELIAKMDNVLIQLPQNKHS